MTDPLGRRRSSVLLEPPKLTTETLDPGAHELGMLLDKVLLQPQLRHPVQPRLIHNT